MSQVYRVPGVIIKDMVALNTFLMTLLPRGLRFYKAVGNLDGSVSVTTMESKMMATTESILNELILTKYPNLPAELPLVAELTSSDVSVDEASLMKTGNVIGLRPIQPTVTTIGPTSGNSGRFGGACFVNQPSFDEPQRYHSINICLDPLAILAGTLTIYARNVQPTTTPKAGTAVCIFAKAGVEVFNMTVLSVARSTNLKVFSVTGSSLGAKVTTDLDVAISYSLSFGQ
mgnify:CR=1 FL=1